jgi:hypothetical protein
MTLIGRIDTDASEITGKPTPSIRLNSRWREQCPAIRELLPASDASAIHWPASQLQIRIAKAPKTCFLRKFFLGNTNFH